MKYTNIITIEPNKRGGKPCIRGLRITVYDVLEYLAGGMSIEEILADFPELTRDDIQACLAFAANRERRLFVAPIIAEDEHRLIGAIDMIVGSATRRFLLPLDTLTIQ
ncbi:MAG: DUF433 domain-containing protein [Thiomargarita sp.]|nr:DUF433 domain-containing protein [Thiomargarita sp.]